MKIIVADDHDLFRESLCRILKQLSPTPTLVEAANHEALAMLADEHPDTDLVITDLTMPGAEPFSALASLIEKHPTLALVVLSGSDRPDEMRRVLDCGAMGFIPKREPPSVLLGALQLVLSGGIYIPPALVGPLVAETPSGINLTPRQKDVLQGLADGRSNKDIGRWLGVSQATVKVHLSAIFRALRVSNRLEAVRAAERMGLTRLNP